MKQYDIFISYRRSSYDTANLIATRLKSAGYSVFFDMETLRSGKFNEQLYEVIDNCKDFLVILPPEALARCVNEDDWVRLEVCRAMNHDKNIIPVMLNGFIWPNPMPKGMEDLCNYQALTASSIEYFDLAMERLQQRYLTAKKHFPIRKVARFAGITIVSLLAVIGILWAVFMYLSRDVCTKYATNIAMDASSVHVIAEENAKLEKDWKEFNNMIFYERKMERIAVLQENMIGRIDLLEKNLKQTWRIDSVKMNISDYHSFLLSMHGVNSGEIAISPEFATLYYKDYLNQLDIMRTAVLEPSSLNLKFVNTLFEVFDHSINSYYASILSELSVFPENYRETYNELSKNWIYFPIDRYEIGKDRKYYENIIITETKLAEESMKYFSTILEIQDSEIEDLERKNDEIEMQIDEGFVELRYKIDSSNAMIEAQKEIEQIKKNNEREIALRKEKIDAKKVTLDATKAELAKLDKEYIQIYRDLKEKCIIKESDDQWYKWGKVRRFGKYLSMLSNSRKELLDKGILPHSSVVPDMVYSDLCSILSTYQTYHPESRDYVASAKQFFKEVSKNEREYAGVLVFAFKDNIKHSFYKEGDIVVAFNGTAIKNYDALKLEYKKDNNGVVTILRLINGRFQKIDGKMGNADIVGFLELTE